jgi:hypothetical protein
MMRVIMERRRRSAPCTITQEGVLRFQRDGAEHDDPEVVSSTLQAQAANIRDPGFCV